MATGITLCMIVRDEEQDLPRCLVSVQGFVDEIVVVDTGSVDGTMGIAQQFGARVRQFAWTGDFAAARNASLELATGDWVLCLDADEALLPTSRSLLRQAVAAPGVEGYYVTVRNLVGASADPQVQAAYALRLWRNRPLYRFVGRVHEQILPAILAVNPQARVETSGITVMHDGYTQERMVVRDKSARNISLLKSELAVRPDDLFLQFHLGLEYVIQGRYATGEKIFRGLLPRVPLTAIWRHKLVKVYAATLLELRRWDKALGLLSTERERYPDYTDLIYLSGRALGELGRHAEAAAAFRAAWQLGPAPCPPYLDADEEMGSCKAQLALGQKAEAMGDRTAALSAYTAAARCRPGWLEPLGCLALLLAVDSDDAALVAALAGFFPEETAQEQQRLARLLAQAGRYRPALERLEQAAKAGDLEPVSRYARAYCLGKLGHYADALAACAGDWQGTGFEVRIAALRLYCEALQDASAPLRPATGGAGQLREVYAELADLLAGASAGQVQALLRRLPRSRVLTAELRRRAQGADTSARPQA